MNDKISELAKQAQYLKELNRSGEDNIYFVLTGLVNLTIDLINALKEKETNDSSR